MRLALVLAVACAASSARADQCAGKVDDLRKRLTAVAGPLPAVTFGIDWLPTAKAGAGLTDPGAVVVLQKDFPVVVGTENLGVDDAKAAEIVARRVKSGVLYVAAYPDESIARVLTVVRPVIGRKVELRLIIRAPAQKSQDVQQAIETIQKASGSCGGIMRALGGASGQGTGRRGAWVARQVPDAVLGCKCAGVDVGALGAVLVDVIASEPQLGWLPMPLVAKGKPAKLAKTATVNDLVPLLAGSPGPLKLELE